MNSTSFEHLLRRARRLADEAPEAPLFQWVDPQKGRTTRVSRAEAWRRSQGVCEQLLRRSDLSPGDRVLLVYPPGLEFIWALIGAMAAGLCPVPAYPPLPARAEAGMAALEGLMLDAGAKVALTSRTYRWVVRGMQARSLLSRERLPQLDWVVTDRRPSRRDRGVPPVSPDAVAFLQYTSGSTRAPRGVQITWGSLQHQLRINRDMLRLEPDSRSVLWVPQYHDLGLISGIMSALWGNGELILTSPASFLRDPGVWMQVVSDTQATHTAAPNFAFGLLLRKTTPQQRASWDLSRLQVLMTAAEPIDAELMDRFFAELAPSGLRASALFPAYGLAEHTVGVTLGGAARLRADRAVLQGEARYLPAAPGAPALTLVGCGPPAPDVSVKVVSVQLHKPLPDGHVGEIWVRSPSVAAGYEGRPEETAATFQATLIDGDGPWLRTGDLGLLHGGELFVTGRLKDLIIIGGRNLAPHDIEQTITDEVGGVRPGCVVAFAVPGQDTEALAVVADLRQDADPAAAVEHIRAALSEAHGLPVSLLLLGRSGLVRKTTSGKVRRRATRAALLSGELARDPALVLTWTAGGDLAATMPADPLRGLAERLPGLSPDEQLSATIDALRAAAGTALAPDEAWATLGIDSIASVEFVHRLEESLGVSLPPRILFNAPTPRRLAHSLLERLGHPIPEAARPQPRLGGWPRRFTPHAGLRVAIVGAGPAGLAAADALAARGYRAVTIFESGPAVGGKVCTATIDGHRVELGAQMLPESYELLADTARRLGVPLVPATGYAAAGGRDRDRISEQLTASDAWWTRLRAAAGGPFGRDWVGGRGPRDPGLAAPLRDWLAEHDLLPLPELVRSLWTDFGYGDLDTPVSAYFFVEYLRMATATPRLSRRGEGGNQRLLQAMADDLVARGVTLRLRCPVTQIIPEGRQVRLVSGDGAAEVFDEVILATAPHPLAQALPPSEPLRALLERYRTLRYGIIVVRTEGLDLEPRVTPVDPCWSDGIVSLVMPLGDGLVALAAYGPASTADDPVAEAIAVDKAVEAVIARLGGRVLEVRRRQMWRYFPHLEPSDTHTLLELEALQGARGLWVTGAAASMEAVEHVMRHARSLVGVAFPAPAADPLSALVRPILPADEGAPDAIWPAPSAAEWCLGPQASNLSSLATVSGGMLIIHGPLEAETLPTVLRWLDANVEVLRIRVAQGPDREGLSLSTDAPPAPLWRDLSAEADPVGAARSWLQALASRPFAPTDPRLYRVGIGRLDAQSAAVLLVFQHTVMDGDAMAMLASMLCAGLAQGCPPPRRLPIPSILEEAAAADIAQEQGLEASLEHWRAWLATLPDVPPPVPAGEGPARTASRVLDLRLSRRLSLAASRAGFSLSDFLTAATGRTARALAPGASHALGVIHQGRPSPGQRIPPTRANILPVRIGAVGDPAALVLAVHEQTQELLRSTCRKEDLGDLCAELGREHPIWTWTTNHYPIRSQIEAGPWTAAFDPEPVAPIAARHISVILTPDPSTGAALLSVLARRTAIDTLDPDVVLERLIAELDAVSRPEVLWALGVGLLG